MKFLIGDLVVRFGKILEVSGIEAELITLKPFFKSAQNQGLVYSIMKKNLSTGQVRALTTRAELSSLWKDVLQSSLPTPPADGQVEAGKYQTLADAFTLVKSLWLDKQKNKGILPGARLSLYQQTLSQASDEVAAIKNMVPETAKALILKTLGKNRPVEDVTL